MQALLDLIGIGAQFAPHFTWGGVVVVGLTSIYSYVRIRDRFKEWVTDLIANTPRSKQAQNGLRQAVQTIRDDLKENNRKTDALGERISTIEGYVLGKLESHKEE